MRLIDADELIKDRVENDPVRIAAECVPTAFEDGKGIIVMDIPKNCGECRLFRHLTGFAQTCGYYNCNTDSQLKLSWCPIKPVSNRERGMKAWED